MVERNKNTTNDNHHIEELVSKVSSQLNLLWRIEYLYVDCSDCCRVPQGEAQHGGKSWGCVPESTGILWG